MNGTGGCIAVVGMFDGVHRGHRYLLWQLRREGAARDLEPMALTFSNHPLELIAPDRAPALLTPPDEKRRLIEAEGIRAEVLPFDGTLRHTSAADFLCMLRHRYGVTALVLGFNNRFGHNAPHDFEAYRALGLQQGVEIIPADEFSDGGRKISSTEIRNLIKAGDVEVAAGLLGRPYRMYGIVEHGKQLGRQIGFPTANLRLSDPRQLLPAGGVYATTAMEHPAMTNIGSRPTVDSDGHPTIETHIIGCSADLYDRKLTIEFRRRLRDERRFPSLDALKAQLVADRAAAQL